MTATYALNLIRGTTIRHSEPFTPTKSGRLGRPDRVGDHQTARSSFGLVLPWEPSETRIELTAAGSTVISMTVGLSPANVAAVSPKGGESSTGTPPITWSASDWRWA